MPVLPLKSNFTMHDCFANLILMVCPFALGPSARMMAVGAILVIALLAELHQRYDIFVRISRPDVAGRFAVSRHIKLDLARFGMLEQIKI